MKKKILALCLVVVLAVTAVTGATLAYFTDTEKASNIMTVGNVDINLEEYKMNEDGTYVPFKSDEAVTLYPMTAEQGYVLNNKVVEVWNDSTEDAAYIRVLVAFEDITDKEGKNIRYSGWESTSYDSQGIHGTKGTFYKELTIDGINYDVYVFNVVSGNPIPAGEKIYPVQSVWLDSALEQKDLKGDTNMNVLVVAQGVQAANFSTAEAAFAATFELTDTNVISWFQAADNAVINDYSAN